MLMAKMEEVYGEDLKGFSPEAQGAMIDYGYGSGNDPRIYMLDQYMKEQKLGDLPGRSDYNDHMDKYEWDDDTYKTQFENQYSQYSDKLNALSGADQLRLMNQGRKFYYDNIQVQNRDAANELIWSKRPFYKEQGGELYKAQTGTEFIDADMDGVPDSMADDPTMLNETTVNASSADVFRATPIPAQFIETESPSRTIEGFPQSDIDGQLTQSNGVNRDKIKGAKMARFLNSPGMNKYGAGSAAVVAGANIANEVFQNRRANQAEKDLRTRSADDLYGVYEEREGDRLMWDVNTGIAQPDNLDLGYAMNGMEMPMMGAPMPRLDTNKEVDLDMETITKLIAAGADIEIL